jgi:deoxycytidine triphosphate deaminase
MAFMSKPEPGQLRKTIGEKLALAGARLQGKTLDQVLAEEPGNRDSRSAGILTDQEIRDLGLVVGGIDANYMSASYDLRVGRLIDPDGKVSTSYLLPAQGIVEAISQETVKLPNCISGFAMVKTRLCQEGILALSIGIIDPRFEGRISSFLINFGKRDKLIQHGDVFLRTTFHHLRVRLRMVMDGRSGAA